MWPVIPVVEGAGAVRAATEAYPLWIYDALPRRRLRQRLPRNASGKKNSRAPKRDARNSPSRVPTSILLTFAFARGKSSTSCVLPSDPEQPVLDITAISTRLTLAQVREEQRRRLFQSR
jgi:hypothetical protein